MVSGSNFLTANKSCLIRTYRCYIVESDFTPITDMELVFSGAEQQTTVSIAITDDDVYENLETLRASLVLVAANVQVTISPSQATVSIENDDRELIHFL